MGTEGKSVFMMQGTGFVKAAPLSPHLILSRCLRVLEILPPERQALFHGVSYCLGLQKVFREN